jgi:hypothetical protein
MTWRRNNFLRSITVYKASIRLTVLDLIVVTLLAEAVTHPSIGGDESSVGA